MKQLIYRHIARISTYPKVVKFDHLMNHRNRYVGAFVCSESMAPAPVIHLSSIPFIPQNILLMQKYNFFGKDARKSTKKYKIQNTKLQKKGNGIRIVMGEEEGV